MREKRLQFSDEAAEMLPQLAGFHGQGVLVSRLIMDEAQRRQGHAPLRLLVAELEECITKINAYLAVEAPTANTRQTAPTADGSPSLPPR